MLYPDSLSLQKIDNPFAMDSNGDPFTNECIAIILNDSNKLADNKLLQDNNYITQRDFIPGSEWVYYKIYAGVKYLEHTLKNKIHAITAHLLEDGIIDKWFFVRYSDPELHIRIRFHVTSQNHVKDVISILFNELNNDINEGVIHNIQIEKYSRELERYGADIIELVESMFHNDSVCFLDFLCKTEMIENGKRWHFGLLAADQLLNDFHLNLTEKYELMNNLSQVFFQEHGGNKNLKIQLDEKFRRHRKEIDSVLNCESVRTNDLIEATECLLERSRLNKEIVVELIKKQNAGNKPIYFLNELLKTHLHMMHNRIFASKQRTNEFIIYTLLSKYYKSEIAKQKQKNKEKASI